MNIIMKVPYVTKRKNTYYFKFNIPEDCRHCLDGRSEFKRSLETDDILTAKGKAEKLATIWKDKIAKIRDANNSDDAPVQVAEIKLDTIVEKIRKKSAPYIEKKIHSCLAKPDAEMRKTLYISIENSIDAYQRCITAGTYTDQELINLINPFSKSDEFALHTCTEFEPRGLLEDDVLTSVARRILPIILDGLCTVKAAIEKELYPERVQKYPVSMTTALSESGPTITEVLNEMLQSTFRAEKTDFNIRANVHLLIEWIGDIPIQCITRANILDFRDNCLRKLPTNITKKSAYDGLTVRQILEVCRNAKLISNRTVNNKITAITQLLNYAVENRYIDFAPAKNLKLPEKKSALNKALTQSELKAMLALLSNTTSRPSRYWVPLLGMYTGARLNELCQIHTDDVYELDGVLILDINDTDQSKTHKQLKNQASSRIIPVHPELLKLGFGDFVRERQSKTPPACPLFKDLTYRKNQGYRGKTSHWFNHVLKPQFLTAETITKNFHSLRYSFIQQCQNQDDPLDDRAIMELTGHSLSNAGISSVHLGYSGKLKPKALYEQISKLDYGF